MSVHAAKRVTHGTPAQRTVEAEKAAAILGATLEFIELDGDAHLEVRVAHAIKLAAILRRIRPGIVLAPSAGGKPAPRSRPARQTGARRHPAGPLRRRGGVAPRLRHKIDHLFYYAVTPDAEPTDVTPVLIDVSAPDIVAAWTAAMEAHASQTRARDVC